MVEEREVEVRKGEERGRERRRGVGGREPGRGPASAVSSSSSSFSATTFTTATPPSFHPSFIITQEIGNIILIFFYPFSPSPSPTFSSHFMLPNAHILCSLPVCHCHLNTRWSIFILATSACSPPHLNLPFHLLSCFT